MLHNNNKKRKFNEYKNNYHYHMYKYTDSRDGMRGSDEDEVATATMSLAQESHICKAESLEHFLIHGFKQILVRGREAGFLHGKVRVEVADITARFLSKAQSERNSISQP